MANLNIPHSIISRIPLFAAFTNYTPTVPKMYWDVYSQEERIKCICENIDKIVAYCNALGIEINTSADEIERLAAEFEEFKSSGFDDYYRAILEAWINEHMPEIIRQAIKMVFFGLTDDGYFCAYIPDSWNDIMFDTGMVYGAYDYGRLILRYNVDGTGVIDNTNVSQSDMESLLLRLAALEDRVGLNSRTLYTPLNRNA